MRKLSLLILALVVSPPSHAGEPTVAPGMGLQIPAMATNVLAKYLTEDRTTPDSPAAAVLGLAPASVLQAGTPAEFHAGLLRMVDAYGNLNEGGAIDINPYMAYAGDQVTLQDYQGSLFVRLLSNTQLSLAAVKGVEETDEATRVSIGLRTSYLWNDPRLNAALLECLGGALQRALEARPEPEREEPTPEQLQQERETAEANARRELDTCRETHQPMSSGGISLGVAPTWESQSASLGGLDTSGITAWGSMSFVMSFGRSVAPGLQDLGTIYASVMYQSDKQVPDPNAVDTFINQSLLTASAGLRFNGRRFGPLTNVAWTLEAGYVEANPKLGDSYNYWQYLSQLQFSIPLISESLIFDISYGQTSDRIEDETFGGLSIRWKFTDRDIATAMGN
jgi:hypothetical protein